MASDFGLRPLEALRGMRALLKDPNDTAQVFRILRALSGRTLLRLHRRLAETEEGRRVLAERRALSSTLVDVERLRAMPDGSLGREYLEFLRREGISAQGLVQASEDGFGEDAARLDDYPELRVVADRMRDMHDLWHVVTGYQGDLVGEAALLAFTLAQTRNPGMAFLVAVAFLHGRNVGTREQIRGGFARGRAAAWLPAQPWEALLPLPLDEVRRRLGVDAPPDYEPVRASEVEHGVTGFRRAAPAA